MYQRVARLFEIDRRSLVAFRVAIAGLIIVDLIIRATALEAHYADAGVLPIEMVRDQYAGTWHWSLHLLHGSLIYQTVLFVGAGAAAVCLGIGFRTRIATILSWMLLTSVHARNPLLLNGGDDLLRMLLLWSIFLPLPSRRPSVGGDQAPPPGPNPIASAAILLQVGIMYFSAGAWKLTGEWLLGNELNSILHYDTYARPLAYELRPHQELTRIVGTTVVVSELVLPILLFVPARHWVARCIVIASLAMMHLGIELTLTVGLFSYVCWAALILFLPTGFWNSLDRLRRKLLEPREALDPRVDGGVAEMSSPREVGSEKPRWKVIRLIPNCIATTAVLASMTYVLASGLTGTELLNRDRIPPAARRFGELFRLQGDWRLFTRVPSQDGWFMVTALLRDGRYMDLLREGVPADDRTYFKPAYVYRQHPNHRWRKFYRNLVNDSNQPCRESLCHFFASTWNRDHDGSDSAVTIELQYMQEMDGPADSDLHMQRFLCTYDVGRD